jgi:hypothetical protein
MGLPALAALVLAPALLVAAPAKQPAKQQDLVLDCYVTQSDRLRLGQFVRHLEVRPGQELVVIADELRGGPLRWVGNGRLVSLDADRLVYDFESSNSAGRTEIDRRTGAFIYRDGRSVISGTCEPSGL